MGHTDTIRRREIQVSATTTKWQDRLGAEGAFQLLFAMFVAHELDAVAQREWRLLYVLRAMPETLAQDVFVLIHVPLLVLLVWLGWHPRLAVREWSRLAMAAFMVVHAGLHWRLSESPLYTFHSPTSVFLIFGSVVPATILLWRSLRRRQGPSQDGAAR